MALSEIILIDMALLTVAIAATGVCRRSALPYTVVLVIAGMLLGGLARTFSPFAMLNEFHLSSDLVFFVFLPALIFESGLNIDSRQLIKDLAAVLMLAIPALLISTALIGVGLWQLLPMNLLTAILFGALISATDPVAVIALFKELGAPQRLTVLVEGESLMNDATAIVVFGIVLNLALQGAGAGSQSWWFPIIEFARVFAGGIVWGIVLGLLASELLARLHAPANATLTMSIVLAYTSFIIAEHLLHISGVMSAASAAVTLRAFGVPRLAQESTGALTDTWELIAYICNAMLFLLVGLSIDVAGIIAHSGPILIALLLVLLARAATVYSLVPIATRIFAMPRIGINERHIMWWGGLKGGLAIAMVLSIPAHLPGREVLLYMTLGIVLFTLLVNATTIRPFMSRLGLDRLNEEEQADFQQALFNAQQRALKTLDRFQSAELISKTNTHRTAKLLNRTLKSANPRLNKEQTQRHVHILAIRTEMEELNRLYEIGMITQYTLYDMRSVLQQDRDACLQPQEDTQNHGASPKNLFLQLERGLLQHLREHDWAAGLLSRYQSMRLGQRIQRDFAAILTCKAVLARLAELEEYDSTIRDIVATLYRRRLEYRKQRLQILRKEFPDHFRRFESRLFNQVTLNRALQVATKKHHDGQLGAKGYSLLHNLIDTTLDSLAPLSQALPSLDSRELINLVPFLKGLSETARDELARHASAVSVLPGDIIIGQHEHGDSMYIITHGDIGVYQSDTDNIEIAVLGEGDFFGEMALLGDPVRSATVMARGPGMLLRLRRRDVLVLAETHPEIMQTLRDVRDSRRV